MSLVLLYFPFFFAFILGFGDYKRIRGREGGVVGALVGSTNNMVGSCSRPTKNFGPLGGWLKSCHLSLLANYGNKREYFMPGGLTQE